jgi:hypothetical protein
MFGVATAAHERMYRKSRVSVTAFRPPADQRICVDDHIARAARCRLTSRIGEIRVLLACLGEERINGREKQGLALHLKENDAS